MFELSYLSHANRGVLEVLKIRLVPLSHLSSQKFESLVESLTSTGSLSLSLGSGPSVVYSAGLAWASRENENSNLKSRNIRRPQSQDLVIFTARGYPVQIAVPSGIRDNTRSL